MASDLKQLRKMVSAARAGRGGGGSSSVMDTRQALLDAARRRREDAKRLRMEREKRAKSAGDLDGYKSELERLIAQGQPGAAAANSTFKRLMASDIPLAQKQALAEVMQGSRNIEDADSNRGFLGRAWDIATKPVEHGLKAVSFPMKAIAAGWDELLEHVYDYDKEGMDRTFWDKAWRDDSFGWGTVLQRATDLDKARGRTGGVAQAIADNKWGARAFGLAGDVVGDPLTYLTFGVGTIPGAAGRGAKASVEATKASRATDALRAAGKVDKATGVAAAAKDAERLLEIAEKSRRFSRRGARMDRVQSGARLAEAGFEAETLAKRLRGLGGDEALISRLEQKASRLTDAAGKMIDQGAGAIPQSVLEEAGLQGGLHFAGRKLLEHDTIRPLTGRVGRLLEKPMKAMFKGASRFGSRDLKELRKLYREGVVELADGTTRLASASDRAGALVARGGKGVGRMTSRKLLQTIVDPLEQTIKTEIDRSGIDGHTLYRAVTGNIEAAAQVEARAPGALRKIREGQAQIREAVNDASGGVDVLADRGDRYMRGITTEQYNDFARKRGWWESDPKQSKDAGRSYRKSNEAKAFHEGDTFMGETLGSPELHEAFSAGYEPGSVGAIQKQMEGIAHRNGLPSNIKMFEEDAFASLRSTVHTASVRAEELATAGHMASSGLGSVAGRKSVGEALGSLERRREKALTALGGVLGEDITGMSGRDLGRLVRERMASATPAERDRITRLVERKTALDTEFSTLSAANTLLAEGPDGLRRRAEQIRARVGWDDAEQARRPGGAADLGAGGEDAAGAFAREADAMRRSAKEESSGFFLSQADKLDAAAEISDPTLRQITVLDAMADGLEGSLHLQGSPLNLDDFMKKLRSSSGEFSAMLRDGFKSMGDLGLPHHELPDWAHEAIARTVKAAEDPGWLMTRFDRVNTHFKAYALLTPGYHVRNFVGGVFNNALDGVGIESYKRAWKINRAHETGDLSNLTEFESIVYRDLERAGFFHDELKIGTELPDSMRTRARIAEGDPTVGTPKRDRWSDRQAAKIEGNPVTASAARRRAAAAVRATGVTDNAITRANTRAGSWVERQLRIANYVHNRGRGLDHVESVYKVHQFHFDYSDLSDAEMTWGRRLIPFWTWTSRNFPLQLEMMMKNPRAYSRFNAVKRNLGASEEGELSFHPQYLRNSPSNIFVGDVPFVGEVMDYYRPDLPFDQIDEMGGALATHGPVGLVTQMSPMLRAPLENMLGVQAFNNAPISGRGEPIPSFWSKIPGLEPILERLPSSYRGRDGRLMISGNTRYTLSQLQPLLERGSKLYPGDDANAQERWLARTLSFFGLGATKVSDRDKSNELFRINDELALFEDRAIKEGKAQSSEERRVMQKLETQERKRREEAEKARKEREKRLKELLGR